MESSSAVSIAFWLINAYSLITNAIIIDTNSGQIEGITDESGTSVFLNIPYAQPPMNKLRWKPPQPYTTPYDGVYDATAPGNACIQPAMQAAILTTGSNGILSEDCLTLSIQTPYNFDKPDTERLRPIFFWIHGGGLAAGTGFSFINGSSDRASLPKNADIVLVSINYRLGIGAWLVDPELYDSPTGNGGANGFLDMIEALKWVKNNIKAYGGDPNEITIGGESGGGWYCYTFAQFCTLSSNLTFLQGNLRFGIITISKRFIQTQYTNERFLH